MPACNAALFLRSSVLSILNQSEQCLELILIDDGSTDDTPRIARELQEGDRRIRFFHQENRGVVAALNRALELCQGDFIARMDADDVAHPQRLERQLALLRSKPDVVICGSEAILIGEGRGRWRRPGSDASCRAWQLLAPCFIHPTVMFRRSVVDAGVRYRAAYAHAEDYEFWSQVGALGKMENIREPLLSYRVHAAQVTRTRRPEQVEMHVAVAASNLAGAGVAVDRSQLAAILFPATSGLSRWTILIAACRLFVRMIARGQFVPRLMLGTLWNIVACH
jgi:glycosyltransferase involved in cell wall biosynthesis